MASAPKNEKILIIEANSSFRDQFVSTLKSDGYDNVSAFENGESGLKGIYDVLPHLILLDIALPDIDGYQILEKKLAEPLLAKIPVFLLSAEGAPINMRNIPKGSVAEVIISLHASSKDILDKINHYFGHEISDPSAGAAADQSVKKKLLWVEDDKLIGTILAKKLMSSGFDLSHAKNGEEALSILTKIHPDLIVVDLLLPGMSGFEILQQVKMNKDLDNVPRMVLSNLSKVSDIDKARALGASKFLVKASTSLDQIVAEIKELAK